MLRLLISRPFSDSELAPWVAPQESVAASRFAPARRSEWLSWRALVRQTLGSDSLTCSYAPSGAPLIDGSPLCLSVSHCRGSIVVALSDDPCAVDIETLDRPFSRLASRYLAPDEALLSDSPLWPAVAWCAKECLYKFSGLQGLDFLHDLSIRHVDFNTRTLSACVLGADPALTLRFFFIAGRVIVFSS